MATKGKKRKRQKKEKRVTKITSSKFPSLPPSSFRVFCVARLFGLKREERKKKRQLSKKGGRRERGGPFEHIICFLSPLSAVFAECGRRKKEKGPKRKKGRGGRGEWPSHRPAYHFRSS